MGDPSGMFEGIYAGAETGGAWPPWDYGAPRPQLVEWAEARTLAGGGREALVVGCGYGADAEFLALLGYRTTGSDFAPTAIAAARRKYPDSEVVMIDSRLGPIHPAAWSLAGDTSRQRYWEFNSRTLTGAPADTTQRFAGSRQLSAADDSAVIARYRSPAFVLGGWMPDVR